MDNDFYGLIVGNRSHRQHGLSTSPIPDHGTENIGRCRFGGIVRWQNRHEHQECRTSRVH